jgi:glycosyltransferase involved in cell wall biosynthesis
MPIPHITVCICTFRRVDLLRRLLGELEKQDTGGAFTFSVVVVDNDAAQSARTAVIESAAATYRETVYAHEPEQNIARARNRTLANARGEYVAFIDDDEFPTPRWLALLLETCRASGAQGVLAPVLPHFATPPPAWIVRGGMFDRPRHRTGCSIGLGDARTGNVLLDRQLVADVAEPFDVRFASGGEDVDFFRRMMAKGGRFIWCDEATVYETVPASRATRGYLLRRALLRGRNSLRQRAGRLRKIATSAVALPLYTLALPFLALAGQHWFMKYLISWCDHAGRLLAAVGIQTVRERDG